MPRVVRVSTSGQGNERNEISTSPAIAHSSLGATVAVWYLEHARILPWREEGFSAWGILVSEVMLQQTPVARVLGPLAIWLERWPTPTDLAAVPSGEAVRAWGRLGYPRRALRLHACAVAITERHGGLVPAHVEDLLVLPGVGEYTARAVSVFAFGQRHPVVDTNVRRVVARAVHGNGQPGPASTTRDLAGVESLLPTDPAEAHVTSAAIMELGAIVCTSKSPRCSECPIAHLCVWRANGYPPYDGPIRATQATYEGSDRQVRGLILAMLRHSDTPVSANDIATVWPDDAQRARAMAGLISDGLVELDDANDYQLPQ